MLASAQIGQIVHYLNLDNIASSETLITFTLRRPLKQSKQGVKLTEVEFTSYPSDPRFCVITILTMYLACTRNRRGNNSSFSPNVTDDSKYGHPPCWSPSSGKFI